jgi:hypothetical protein
LHLPALGETWVDGPPGPNIIKLFTAVIYDFL